MCKTYRVHLSLLSASQIFNVILLDRSMHSGSKVWIEGFYCPSSAINGVNDGVICIRSSALQDTSDYDSRTASPSRIIAKFPRLVSSSFIYYVDSCLCDMNAGYTISNLNCLHGTIDIQLTNDLGEALTVNLSAGTTIQIDLLIVEPSD